MKKLLIFPFVATLLLGLSGCATTYGSGVVVKQRVVSSQTFELVNATDSEVTVELTGPRRTVAAEVQPQDSWRRGLVGVWPFYANREDYTFVVIAGGKVAATGQFRVNRSGHNRGRQIHSFVFEESGRRTSDYRLSRTGRRY